MNKSLQFYHKQLGFEIEFEWEDPPSYVILSLNKRIQIHLSQYSGARMGPLPSLYFFVNDIDLLYQKLTSAGIKITCEIGDRDYQMRDFDIEDPDGNQITIGQGSSHL